MSTTATAVALSAANSAQIAQQARSVRENLPALLEMADLSARLARAKFLALVREGFTEAQALELCKGG